MTRGKGAAPLPDLDDEELKRRLAPLADAALPAGQGRGSPSRVPPPSPPAAPAPMPVPLLPIVPPVPVPAPRPSAVKPPRKGIEFLLPETVVTEIKTRAAQRGVTATILLLELLRDAGYPVTEADFTDLRRLPRR
jgi:hypothetical protein